MKISELRHKIDIEKLTVLTNDRGFEEKRWVPYYSCRAKASNLHGKEFYAAMTINAETTIEFTMRSCIKLKEINTKEYRVKFRNKVFDILFIDEVLYNNTYVKFKVKEVV